MSKEQVIDKLGWSYSNEGSGAIILRYLVSDGGQAFLTFFDDKLINVMVKYRTGEVKKIITPKN